MRTITKVAPVEFNTAAMSPRWDSFLQRIMAGNANLIAYLQRIAGMCLTGDVREQYLFMFYGQGANGKSVFLDTFVGLLGVARATTRGGPKCRSVRGFIQD